MKDPKLYTTEIQKSVKDAIEEKYSKLEGKKQVLQIKNITFDPLPEPDDYERQKQILNKRGNEGVNVYADMSLHDKQTGQVIASSKKAKISFLPTMTNRYTFIVNGKEYIPSNQLRLRPAIYTKVDRTGVCSADFNLAKGKNMTLAYQPAKGGFNLTINKSHM
jgi:DNA-directed RNA polymerase beta subunit